MTWSVPDRRITGPGARQGRVVRVAPAGDAPLVEGIFTHLNSDFGPIVQTLDGGSVIELRDQDDDELIELGDPDDLLP